MKWEELINDLFKKMEDGSVRKKDMQVSVGVILIHRGKHLTTKSFQ